jgi:hypothetical protein
VQRSRNSLAGAEPTAATLDLRERFEAHAKAAVAHDVDDTAAGQMVSSGFLLARASCGEFFDNAAVLQRDADISRSMITPIITILDGIIALRNFSDKTNDKWSKILALGSGAALAGISIVDQHFLFGADNIKEVRDLTFDALAANEEAIAEIGTPTFDVAMEQLIEHQVICSPANILSLTRQAIQAGDVVADIDVAQSQDEQALVRLGTMFKLIGPANSSQLAVLWALYQSGVSTDNIPAALEEDAKAAGLGRLIIDSVDAIPATDTAPAVEAVPAKLSEEGLSKADQITAILKSLSVPTKRRLAEAVKGTDDARGGRMSLRSSDIDIVPLSRSRKVKLIVQ